MIEWVFLKLTFSPDEEKESLPRYINYISFSEDTPIYTNLLLENNNPGATTNDQFVGIESKSINITFENRGLVRFTTQLIASRKILESAHPDPDNLIADDVSNAYIQGNGSTNVFVRGIRSMSINSVAINNEFTKGDQENINGQKVSEPNGQMMMGLSGEANLTDESFRFIC